MTRSQPCLSSLSLDRTGADALISAEFVAGRAGGRTIRWPLNAATALPRADDGSTCGTTTAVAWSCIHRARIGSAPSVLTPAPPLLQNLSYAPLPGRLWGLNEQINTSVGKRVVFSVKVPA